MIGRLGLPLGADEEHLAARRGRLAHEVERLLEARQRLVEVDDVDAVALAEEERLHARVPAPGLVPEVDARFEQLADAELALLKGGGGLARAARFRRGGHLGRGLGHVISFAVVRPFRAVCRPAPPSAADPLALKPGPRGSAHRAPLG